MVLIFTFYDHKIELYEAFIFVGMYGLYIYAVINWRKIFPYEDIDEVTGVDYDEGIEPAGNWEKVFKPIDFVVDKLFPPIKYYYSVFFISILFIAGLSWVLVESAIVISEVLEIPKVIIALTVLAVGTSVPDMISSVIVAKQGRGGMALSNAVGSNIFDILIGLGLPWAIIIIVRNSTVSVVTDDLFVSVILLFASVLVILVILVINNWTIGKKAGIFLVSLYLVFLMYVILDSLLFPS
jgi:Ca2+/Na+ antiporter